MTFSPPFQKCLYDAAFLCARLSLHWSGHDTKWAAQTWWSILVIGNNPSRLAPSYQSILFYLLCRFRENEKLKSYLSICFSFFLSFFLSTTTQGCLLCLNVSHQWDHERLHRMHFKCVSFFELKLIHISTYFYSSLFSHPIIDKYMSSNAAKESI